jgi:hypothetical protein
MSFSIRLGADVVSAEAGATTPVALYVENNGAAQEQFEMEIEGIDPEWKAVPVPVVTCGSGESCSERFFFKPPRSSESVTGNYPFVVRVRSLESGETRMVQGVLEVRPFHHLSMEIDPKRGVVSPTRQQNVFDVTVVNLGNAEHTVRLQGNDPEDALAFEFEQEQINIGPGQQRTIEAVAVPTSSRLISSGRLIGFTITGRSVDAPSVVASSQAQLEQRSLFSPASLVVILLFLLIGALWYLNMPKPPTITAFSVDPDQVVMGQPVTLKWTTSDATLVRISADGQTVAEESTRMGEYEYTPPVVKDKDRVVFELVAERNGTKSEPARVTLHLTPPEVIPDPVIEKLSVNDSTVKLGEPFILSYKFNEGVVRAVLSPNNVTLDPALPNISIPTTTAGRTTYTVTAYNKANKTVAKTFSVHVVDVSDATIISFLASPNPVPSTENRVNLTWSVIKAVRVQLKASGRPLNIDETSTSGSVEVDISSKTTYTLTAYDEKGRPTNKNVVVNIQKPPEPEPDAPPIVPGEDDETTAGATDGGKTTGETAAGGTTGR